MKKLILLRGSARAGKSTFVKKMGLDLYTLSADDFRLYLQSPVLTENGNWDISQYNNSKVWNMLIQMMEERMKLGDFIVIDATHSKASDLQHYKTYIEKYRYRAYVIDFTTIPIEEVKRRNFEGDPFKRVKERTIEKMYHEFANESVPSYMEVISPEEAESVIQLSPEDFSHYKRINHIGDIHGCYSVLSEYFTGGLKEDELYIFTGDYLDRGIENAEVLYFLIRIMNKPNVILLMGNHEIHMWKWANKERSYSQVFEKETKLELEEKGVDKRDVRRLYRKMRTLVYYTYGDKTVLVTHGGLPLLPENLNLINHDQIVKGVGNYETPIDEIFTLNENGTNHFQIHGHRNLSLLPIKASENSFNLEGQVEYGGELRIVSLSADGFECTSLINKVFKVPEHVEMVQDVPTLLHKLRESDDIQEKQFGNISSFNFKRDVFYDGTWNLKNIKARGMFINTNTLDIVCRGYEKFFNIGERLNDKIDKLDKTLTFPVTAYVKENGYLGMVGYDRESDKIVFASKSTIGGDYAGWLKEQFMNIINLENQYDKIKEFMLKNNVGLIFEVIEPVNDPHIIDNPKQKIILLDVMKRTPKFDKYSYEEMIGVAHTFGFEYKKKACVLKTYQEFLDWYNEINKDGFIYDGEQIEGFVIEDSKNYMVKVKLPYYLFWKHLRTLKDNLAKVSIDLIKDPTAKEFLEWVKTLPADEIKKDIVYLRHLFLLR